VQAELADHSTVFRSSVKPRNSGEGETWAIVGKQSRLTSDVATSAVLI
jgi:hypothetical protein